MEYYSTNRKVPHVSFEDAIFQGLPEDNGLYMPERIEALPSVFFDDIDGMSLAEVGYQVSRNFIEGEIEEESLKLIVEDTLDFDIPLVEIATDVYSLELFHGPTFAFKDVGARFLARCLSYFSAQNGKKATILVATSGDTGSAVANGFFGIENIKVVILYPKGKVSEIQEKQLTTLGKNVSALEVEGNFDDCQALVKQAFLDENLKKEYALTSANSINIARLIPQTFYYFWAYKQLKDKQKPLVISVPSGNYGNLTAGVMAKRMGLPINKFIAASNANNIIPSFLESGKFEPKPSIQTISNAMDVGNPSNFYRLFDLYNKDLDSIKRDLIGHSFDDAQTEMAMLNIFKEYQYTLDPHGAVAYNGLEEYFKENVGQGIFLETAHPSKFIEVVEKVQKRNIDIPPRLSDCMRREKNSTVISNSYDDLVSYFEKRW